MISAKAILLAMLAAATVLGATLERRDTFVTCQNTRGNIKISNGKAEGNIHAAPLLTQITKELVAGSTKSGYPHQFKNENDPITWPNSKCNNLPSGSILLEFPVFADGHLYNWNSKPKDDPGAVRAIYTSPHKDFCGVIAHENGNMGPLRLCT